MIKEGTKVEWQWGDGKASGEVAEVYHSDISKQIDGETIKRKASKDEPAYLIRQDDGQKVLKSRSEVERS
jgi:hypothetical protein